MLRQCIRCDAPFLSLADYDFIIQCCNNRPRSKVLNELKEKYSISQKCIYQIWKGKEKNRVAWDQPIYLFNSEENLVNEPILSLSDLKKENLVNKPILAESVFKNCKKAGLENLNAFYEKEAIRDKKNIAKYLHILAK